MAEFAPGQTVDPRVHPAHFQEPPGQVPPAIAPGRAAVATEAEINCATALIEFLRDLATGGGAADDKDPARRQLVRIQVSARMHLEDVGRKRRGTRRRRSLKRACCNHDPRRCDHRIVRVDQESARIRLFSNRDNFHAAADWSVDEPRIVLDELCDLAIVGERIRILALVREAWQPQCPVRKLEEQ